MNFVGGRVVEGGGGWEGGCQQLPFTATHPKARCKNACAVHQCGYMQLSPFMPAFAEDNKIMYSSFHISAGVLR